MSEEVLRRRPGVLEARVSEEELVLLGPDSEEYFGLDSIAADIWERLERPMSREALVELLAQDYDAPRDRIAQDLRPALELVARRRSAGAAGRSLM